MIFVGGLCVGFAFGLVRNGAKCVIFGFFQLYLTLVGAFRLGWRFQTEPKFANSVFDWGYGAGGRVLALFDEPNLA